jgi:hypothetical protein
MKEQTFNRRLQQLVLQLNIHSHRDELLRLMAEQIAEDTSLLPE